MSSLINKTKKEYLIFANLPFSKPNEILANEVACLLVTWYLLNNKGDEVLFIYDYEGYDSISAYSSNTIDDYTEVTESSLDILISLGLLEDKGKIWQDDDDPSIYERDIRRI